MRKRITKLTALLLAGSLSVAGLTGCGAEKVDNTSLNLTELSVDELAAKAKEEGKISSVGMPDDWANWKASWESITAKYGIQHDDTDMSSAEELSMFETEKDAPTKDIGDVGQAFGQTAIDMDVALPFKASTWESVPDWAKDPEGRWVISYYGTMSCMINRDNVGMEITSWKDLMDSGATLNIGDVTTAAASQMSVLSCAYAMGGGMDDISPAIDYFKELAAQGRIDAAKYSQERMVRGEIDVVTTWDYLTLGYRDLTLNENPDMNISCHVMSDGSLQSGYALVINKYAPHPYSAALTVEYMLSDEGQINRAQGYARPIRSDVEIPEEIASRMIDSSEYQNGIPLTDSAALTKACEEIAKRWEEEIIPLLG